MSAQSKPTPAVAAPRGAALRSVLKQYSRYARLMRLDRPIGIWLLLWPTLWALWIASAGRPRPDVFVVLVIGTILVRSAGCVINDWADRRIDPHVRRTAKRPIAAGQVTPAEALILFAGLMLIALGLVLTMNRLTVLFALVGAVLAIFYPFTKRFLSAPQFVLGLAFSWGVPMAYAAQTGGVTRVGWLLFFAAIAWVVAYDTEYAIADRDDDIKIGVRSTAILLGELDRAFVGLLQALLLTTLALAGKSAELGIWYYGGLAVAAAFGLYQHVLLKDRDPASAFRAFLNNAWLGGAVFGGIVLDYVFRG